MFFDSFNAEFSSKRYWRGRRANETEGREEVHTNSTLLVVYLFKAEVTPSEVLGGDLDPEGRGGIHVLTAVVSGLL